MPFEAPILIDRTRIDVYIAVTNHVTRHRVCNYAILPSQNLYVVTHCRVAARMAELVDARDLKSLGPCDCASSILAPGTRKNGGFQPFGAEPPLWPCGFPCSLPFPLLSYTLTIGYIARTIYQEVVSKVIPRGPPFWKRAVMFAALPIIHLCLITVPV